MGLAGICQLPRDGGLKVWRPRNADGTTSVQEHRGFDETRGEKVIPMATARVPGVRIAGIASAVPATRVPVTTAAEIFGADMIQKISQNTGIEYRHLTSPGLCSSDLCFAAAKRLLEELRWEPASVEARFRYAYVV